MKNVRGMLVGRISAVTMCKLCRAGCSTNSFTYRTHNCGQLNRNLVGEEVDIYGWVAYSRAQRFVVLRDLHGSVQAIANSKALKKMVKKINLESVVRLQGIVQLRPDKEFNSEMKSGEIEISISNIELVNAAPPGILMHTSKDKESLQEEKIRLTNRYLDIRRISMQQRLMLRSQVIHKMRRCLIEQLGFFEIETPTLFVRTPGGAAEFPVPVSKKPLGRFYSLVQSPQQFKQLLMVGGMDRYFQVARCYRDEKTRSQRQPEFTQLDIELSFTNQNFIRRLVEKVVTDSWPNDLPASIPFEEMKYDHAMKYYGSDKPDIRFDWKLHDLTSHILYSDIKGGVLSNFKPDSDSLIGFVGPNELTKIDYETMEALQKTMVAQSSNCPIFMSMVKSDGNLNGRFAEFVPDKCQKNIVNSMNAKPDDVIVLSFGKGIKAREALGFLRQKLALNLHENDVPVFESKFKFLWIVDFPLFLRNETSGELESGHHPFTAPIASDMKELRDICSQLSQNVPLDSVIAQRLESLTGDHFDLVLNGTEIGGGSMRIHESKLQSDVMKHVLKLDTQHLKHLLEALNSGAPPHGGIALGLDRYMGLLCGTNNIRDVIAFPKSKDGADLLSGAPLPLPKEELLKYGIAVLDPPQKHALILK